MRRAPRAAPPPTFRCSLGYLARGGGFATSAVQSDDLTADVVAMRRRGVDGGRGDRGARRTPAGPGASLEGASLGPAIRSRSSSSSI